MKTVIRNSQKIIHYVHPSRPVKPRGSQAQASRRVALIDPQGNIVAVNKDWATFAGEVGDGSHTVRPGANYFEVCGPASGSSMLPNKALIGIRRVLNAKIPSFSIDYASHTASGPAYFRMSVTPIIYKDARAAVVHTDITDLELLKARDMKRIQQFARRLIKAQEDERQRISRELHDDVGGKLALMSFSVRKLMEQSSEKLGSSANELVNICGGITDLAAAMRNLSHRLHPPPLRCLGIRAALKSLFEEFQKAYRIEIDFNIPDQMPRLANDVELCLFRIAQESLLNVVKHSGASKVRIVLEHTPKQIRLTVSDTGRGFNPAEASHQGGLGLISMEERALSIRGFLTVNSMPGSGTKIRLTIPVQPEQSIYV